MRVTVTKGWIKEWEKDSTFTIVFDTEAEAERKALLDSMRDNKSLKITIEEVDE